VKLIAEELNTNRETVRHIITEDLGMIKMSSKMVLRILTDNQRQRWLHSSSVPLHNADMFDRVITGDKRGVGNATRKQDVRAYSEKHRIQLGRKKSTNVFLAVQDHAFVFLPSEGNK
jgi:hypothetical protein